MANTNTPFIICDLLLARLAKAAGLLVVGEPISPQLREFAMMVMEKCAAVADPFVDDEHEQTAGDLVRQKFGVV